MLRFLAFFSLWVAFWPAAGAPGQLMSPASLSGRVTDTNNRPLQDVEARLLDTSSGRTLIAALTSPASSRSVDLRAGRYALSVFKEGYAARRLPERELLPDSPVEVVIALEALPPPLTRPRAGIETIALEYGLAREQIDASPVLLGSQGRTAIDKLQQLVPGLTPVEPRRDRSDHRTRAAVSANGSRRSAINYQFDGAANNAQNRLTGAQAATFAPVPEAIETFRAVTHTYSAADGRNAGAVIRAISRGGGSTWHGQIRGFVRPHNQKILSYDGGEDSLGGWAGGGQIGGPLWKKKKLFLFADVEGWRARQRHIAASDTLSLAERSGDLSALDPLPLDPTTMTPFPNGVIPQDRLDPLMQKYLDAFLPQAEPSATRSSAAARTWTRTGRRCLGGWIGGPAPGPSTPATCSTAPTPTQPLADRSRHALAGGGFRAAAARQQRPSVGHLRPAESFQQTTRLAGQRLSTSSWQGVPGFSQRHRQRVWLRLLELRRRTGHHPRRHAVRRLRASSGCASRRSCFPKPRRRRTGSSATTRSGGSVRRCSCAAAPCISAGLVAVSQHGEFRRQLQLPHGLPSCRFRTAPNGVRDLLLGSPGEYRLQTPRDLNLRWREFAFYGETELRPRASVLITLGTAFMSRNRRQSTRRTASRLSVFRRKANAFPTRCPTSSSPATRTVSWACCLARRSRIQATTGGQDSASPIRRPPTAAGRAGCLGTPAARSSAPATARSMTSAPSPDRARRLCFRQPIHRSAPTIASSTWCARPTPSANRWGSPARALAAFSAQRCATRSWSSIETSRTPAPSSGT